MKLAYSVDGDVRAIYGSSAREGKRAVTKGIGTATDKLKWNWRGQITSAGLGTRLGNAVRGKVYPTGIASFHPAGLVWSNAQDIMESFETGPTIVAKGGRYLAIPLPAAGKMSGGGGAGKGGRRGITPAGWEQKTGLKLRFVSRPGRPALLVTEGRQSKAGRAVVSRSKTGRGLATIPIFVLVASVKMPKKLSLMKSGEEAMNGLAEVIVAAWRDV